MYDLNIDGFTSEHDLMQIEKWASSVPKNGVIVELGSYKGRSSYAWAMSCDSSVTVYCLDIFMEHFIDEFIQNTKDIKNIKPIQCHIPLTYGKWVDQEIDIFFLDGNHSNPDDIEAINHFLPLIKKGGVICGHDYYPHRDDPDAMVIIDNIKILEERLNQKVQTFEHSSLWAFNV